MNADPLIWASILLIVLAGTYNFGLFLLSRRKVPLAPPSGEQRFYVFLLACLNEEMVLGDSLARITELPAENCVALVIDDASDDRTAEIARAADPDRVWLHQRHLPDARRGKGAALNDGVRLLRASGLLGGRDPQDVIICVVDADGRLDRHVIEAVDPFFNDPSTGATQIGVRMYNREKGLLARLQDMEFVVYGDVFQSARRFIGSVGMGGNGQFMRLSALDSLGENPWSDSLTEDLDLGVRLIAKGWTNQYCPTAAVSQQAVLDVRRLVRQRSRWFQGHLQSADLAPLILRDVPGRAAMDLIYHLSSPVLILLTSLLPLSFLVAVLGTVAGSVARGEPMVDVMWFAGPYVLSFTVAWIYGFVYRQRERTLRPLQAALLGHAFVFYGYIWFAAGWMGVWRTVTGKTTWLKTARS
ncbi:glycosyltransferase family 2 protein [Streptomyces clavuligerus]|uniref:Putative N-acetyl-glucosamine transferase n=1 Tax=Streptomyces clavuligerus TaxID=1901 RepID=E2Q860_STRCL|nr:glycosyltransferase family 2 protein [Streptomyces clavuligerus]ANW21453.1 glycosyl transferase family 2 [Streptomyces clavuligerus]AXU16086.1 glycosyltransferase [Streptomyces clavuligerus]EFG05392.1 Putative N-acetyl-glucosamine transferase [Streptomyces clavuligerus]MBY6306223.1 glycosyltransferase family 2 protein [Streptomyces clavuligerus]QCS08864.1 glycosyl transferase family 2 [Streptomyces clavuligerus]